MNDNEFFLTAEQVQESVFSESKKYGRNYFWDKDRKFYTVFYEKELLCETSLARVWQHNKQNGFIFISAFREEAKDENLNRHEELKSIIRSKNLGFNVMDGYWIENKGYPNEVHVDELTLFIPYRGDAISEDDFKKLASELGKKYNQDAYVIKVPSENFARLIFRNGSEEKLTKYKPDEIEQAYTKFRTGKHKNRTFVLEGYEYPSNSFSFRKLSTEGHIF